MIIRRACVRTDSEGALNRNIVITSLIDTFTGSVDVSAWIYDGITSDPFVVSVGLGLEVVHGGRK